MPSMATEAAQDCGPRRPRGRPRSAHADRAIVEAALDLLIEGLSLDGLSVEAIASRAGVGKATIYRRWSNKQLLVADVIASVQQPASSIHGETVREDLVCLVEHLCHWAAGSISAQVMPRLVGEMARHPELLRQYTGTALAPWTAALRRVLGRGVATGELRPGTDIDVVATLLPSTVLAALLFDGTGDGGASRADLPADLAVRTVDAVLSGIGQDAG